MLGGVDHHVLGQHGAVDDAGPVRRADRDQESPPHPGRVPGVDAAGKRGPDLPERPESVEPLKHAGLALGARARITLSPRLDKPGKERTQPRVHLDLEAPERDGLAAHQVVVRRVPDQLEHAVPYLVQVGDVALGDCPAVDAPATDTPAADVRVSLPQPGQLAERVAARPSPGLTSG